MTRPLVHIILLNYNNYQDTLTCFESLQNITNINYHIVIVDNNSPNNSMDQLKDYFSKQNIKYNYHPSLEVALTSQSDKSLLTLIQSGYNGGYGFGNNIGIKYAVNNNADYILILNNDTIVDKHFLKSMVEMCEKNEKIGIASAKIYYHDKPDTIWFNGGKFNPWTGSIRHYNFNERDVGQIPPDEITFISGCMMLLPKATIQQVGLFNEEYFMYIEDLEYSNRVLQSGFKLKIYDKGKIYHKVGSSTGGQFSKLSVYWRTKNVNFYLNQYVDNSFKRCSAKILFNFRTFYKLLIRKKIMLLPIYFKAIKHSFIKE